MTSNEQRDRPTPPNRSKSTGWTLTSSLVLSSVGIVVGAAAYYAHQWISKKLSEQTAEADEESIATKHQELDQLSSQNELRRRAITKLARNIELRFSANQQISDATALRSLSTIRSYIKTVFDVVPLTDLLRNTQSSLSLTPTEKHDNFNTVKVFCFCRLISSLYILLLRLWLHRIEINILGRQWLPQFITGDDETTEYIGKALQREIEDYAFSVGIKEQDGFSSASPQHQPNCELVLTQSGTGEAEIQQKDSPTTSSECSSLPLSIHSKFTPADEEPTTPTMFGEPPIGMKSPFFSRSRIAQYSKRQLATLHSTDKYPNIDSNVNYAFLSSTRYLESNPGLSGCANLVKPIVEEVLSDLFPHHCIDSTRLANLLHQICENVEAKIFSPISSNPGELKDSSFSLFIIDLLLPETISQFPNVGEMEVDESVNKEETSNIVSNCFDSIPLTADEDIQFVQGCLAETRDILESHKFRSAFIESREVILSHIHTLLLEKFPSSVTQSGGQFALCKIFGKLTSIGELLLSEVCENNIHNGGSEVADPSIDLNSFATLFSELPCVDQICDAIYLPVILSPDITTAASSSVRNGDTSCDYQSPSQFVKKQP